MVAASVPGGAHLRRGQPSQDALLLLSRLDGSLLLAAADGAGSAARAACGAQTAVAAALRYLATRPLGTSADDLREALDRAMRFARRSLERQASCQETALGAYACTLLLAVLTENWLGALQLGDGAIVWRHLAGFDCLTTAWHGDYAGETVFLTSESYRGKASRAVRPARDACGVALLSDGLEPVALQGRTPFPGFFAPLFDHAAKSTPSPAALSATLADFLSGERLAARSDDDKTLILAVRL